MTDATDCLFVVPMHRSGSSAFARVLNLLGAALPDRLLGATKANALGHWEPSDVVRVNDRILASVELAWDSLLPFPPGWFDTPDALAHEKSVTSVLRRNYVGRPLWLMKDPRLSRTLPLWLKRMRAMRVRPVAVHPVRNPVEVAESLHARDGMALSRGLQLWLRYMLEGEANTRALPRLFVPYDDLLADWRAVAGRVSDGLGVTWPVAPDAASVAIGGFLSEGQRHHRIPLAGRTDVPRDVLAVYEATRRLVRDPADAGALSVLDDARRRLDGDVSQAIAADVRAERRRVREAMAAADARLAALADFADRTASVLAPALPPPPADGPPPAGDAASRIEAALVALSTTARPADHDDPVARAAATADRLAALTATLLRDGVLGGGPAKAAETADVAALEAELARIQAERTRAETLAGELQERVGALRAERDRLAREREVARRERDQARRDNGAVHNEVEALRLELERLWPERRREAEERERLLTDNRRLAAAADDLRAAADRSRTTTRAAVRLLETDWRSRAEAVRRELRAAQAAWQPADGSLRTYGVALAARLEKALEPLPSDAEQIRRAGLAGESRGREGLAGLARGPAARLARRLAPAHFAPQFYAEAAGLAGRSRSQLIEHYLREGHRAGLDPSPLFSTRFYRAMHLDGDEGVNPLVHYLDVGAAGGLPPHRLFDPAFYAAQLSPTVRGVVDPLVHYDEIGWRSGLDPHPAFSSVYYLLRAPDVRRAGLSPLLHYLAHGRHEGREPNPLFSLGFIGDAVRGVQRSPLHEYLTMRPAKQPRGPDVVDPHPLFNVPHYRGVARHGRDNRESPLTHFFRVGIGRLLSPTPAFDVDHYLVGVGGDTGGLHPLIDLVAGRGDGDVAPHPAFDPVFYRAHRRLEGELVGPPLADYVETVPAQQLVPPHPLFDVDHYLARSADVVRRGANPLVHYLGHGWRSGRSPNPEFDPAFYRRDLGLPAEVDPFVHWLRFGHDLDIPGRPPARPAPSSVAEPPFAFTPALPRSSEPREVSGVLPFDPLVGSVLVVGHVVGRERYGGERSFLDMLEGLSGVGLNVVAALPRDEASYTAAVRERSSKVVVLPYGWWRGGEAASEGVVSAFAGVIARYRVEVVHANTVMLLEPLVAARRAGVAAVVHAREILAHDPALCERIGLSAEEIVSAVWSRTDVVIANSAACAAAYAAEAAAEAADAETAAETGAADGGETGAGAADGTAADGTAAKPDAAGAGAVAAGSSSVVAAGSAADRVVVVSNAVDVSGLDVANPVPPSGPVRFALISSNVAKKGLEDLVRLARACAAAGIVDARFVVVGPETETVKALKEGQAAGEVPASLEFAGYAEGPLEALAGVQVVLNLSRFAESFGRTVAEAMAARRPVIAYRWGALPELVEDGVTGFLVPYGEAEAAVGAVRALVEDRSLIVRMGEAGRSAAVARFGAEAYRSAMAAAYARIRQVARERARERTSEWMGGDPSGGERSEPSWRPAVPPAITAEALAVRLPAAGEGAVVLPARERPWPVPTAETPTADCPLPTAGAQSAPLPTAVAQSAPLPTAGARDARPRIGYFLWHFPVPSETFVLNELRHLVAAGYDVRVWCRQSPHKDFVPDFPVEWERVATPEELAARLVATGRTAVHAHFTYPTVTDMVWPACEIAGVPFTFIAHSQDIFRHANDAKNRVGEIGRSPWCRKVFVPARFHRDYLIERGVPVEKLAVNPNGVDVDAYALARRPERAKRAQKRIVAVHRFTEKKGLEPLIAAMAILARRAQAGDAAAAGITLALHGYGELEERFAALIAQGNGEGPLGNVTLAGPVKGREALVAVLRDAELFACPSVRAADGDMDGIPTVVLEAMAAGLPVLSTEIGGLGELVVDGLTGVTVPAAEPEALAAAILRYFSLSDGQVAAMAEAGIATVSERYRIDRLMRVLIRTWENRGVDLVIVAWNNPAELVEVIDRLHRFTASPFHLVVVDNLSDEPTRRILVAEQQRRPSMTLVLNDQNAFVGPGTNLAMAEGSSDTILYVCGKEGFALAPGWDLPFVHALAEDPSVGLAGTLCHAPTYLTGKDYPSGVRLFEKFRNKAFAAENPERPFEHVQGGLFAIRRAMVEAIGGFSDAVPHDYTDVEFSYFAESCGWRLAAVPGILSLYRKTRPGLMERIDERVAAAHPPTLAELPALDAIANGRARHCNLCGWTGKAFLDETLLHGALLDGAGPDGAGPDRAATAAAARPPAAASAAPSGAARVLESVGAAGFVADDPAAAPAAAGVRPRATPGTAALCPGCRSTPADRAVYAVLAASPWLNRRLPALVVGATGKLAEICAQHFQGPQTIAAELAATLSAGRRVPLKDGSRRFVLAMNARTGEASADAALLAELARLAAPGAPILLHDAHTRTPIPPALLARLALETPTTHTTPSKALQTHHDPVLVIIRQGGTREGQGA